MNSTALKSFSGWELAAGIVALAAVTLIGLVGLRVPRQQVSSAAEPSSISDTVLSSSQSFPRASGEQPSERGAIRESQPVAVSSAKAGSTSSTPLPASTTVVTSSSSADATSPNVQTASAGPMTVPLANGSAQIAVQEHTPADQVPAGYAPRRPRSANLPAPPAAKWSSLVVAPADAAAAEPIAGPAVPLPRRRPDPVAAAEAAIPLPQPRPDAAGPGEPQTAQAAQAAQAPAGPSDWLSGIFRSSPSTTAQPDPVHQSDY